jgi:hypothetical protein
LKELTHFFLILGKEKQSEKDLTQTFFLASKKREYPSTLVQALLSRDSIDIPVTEELIKFISPITLLPNVSSPNVSSELFVASYSFSCPEVIELAAKSGTFKTQVSFSLHYSGAL